MALPPVDLNVQAFAPLIGQNFVLVEGGFEIPLELVSVTERPEHRSGPEFRVPFFLQFRSSTQPLRVYPQRIYRLRQAVLGDLEIFLVPSGKDATSVWYQATFN